MKKWLLGVLSLSLCAGMTACNKNAVSSGPEEPKINIVTPEEGFATGYATDVMRTAFFDYTVNSGYTTAAYDTFTAEEGKVFLVVDITITNTQTKSCPMFDTDFQVQWGEDEDPDAFSYPLTAYGETPNGEMLPEEYELAISETRTGKLVYQVPQGYHDFSVSYMEVYDTEETGDTFFVYFTAEQR